MLLTRQEKETLKNYATNLEGFILENVFSEEQIEKLQRELILVKDKLHDSKANPMFEIIDIEGNTLQRISNVYKLEEFTGCKRIDALSRMKTLKYVDRKKRSHKFNGIYNSRDVFSVYNAKTDERVFIRILEN